MRSGEGWENLPSEVLAAFDGWCASHDGDIALVRWLTGGLSGSPVGVVRWFERGNDDRQLIIKFHPDGPEEARLTRRALNLSPDEFRRRHLVELADDPVPLGKWWMIRQRIAGGDLSTMRPLADFLGHADLAAICRVIADSVLREWNPRAQQPAQVMKAHQFVRDHLGTKLAPDGSLSRWVAEHGLSPDEHWVRSDGFGHLPNPLALATDRPSTETGEWLYIKLGSAHGDLNARNVLLRPGRPDEFRLIDLGRFSDRAPLVRDPIHLLLAMASDWVKDFTPRSPRRVDLIRAIVTPEEPSAGPVTAYGAVSRAIHEAGQSWADDKGWGDQWRLQARLSLIGCGLLFAGRHEIGDDRRWFFDLAAYACQEYFDLNGPPATQPPPPPRVTSRPEPPGPAAADPGTGRPGGAPAGVPRDLDPISRALSDQLDYGQRVMGNKDNLAQLVMRLFDRNERFVRLAPCRLSGSTPGSAVIALSDRGVHLTDIDTSYRPSGLITIAYGDIRDIVLHNDRRFGVRNTADIALSTASGEFIARGLLRWQAEAVVSDLESLAGRRLRQQQ